MSLYNQVQLLFIFCLITQMQSQTDMQFKKRCIEGVSILTRRPEKNGKYSLKYQCLCPIDFFGESCKDHRQIRCYLSQKSQSPVQVIPQNYHPTLQLNLQTNIECYIQSQGRKFVSIPQFILQRQLLSEKLQYSLESGEKGVQIVWANTTDIFDFDGRVKIDNLNGYISGHNQSNDISKQMEEKIMYGKGPVKFTYNSNFLGIPLSKSSFFVVPQIIRPTQNRMHFQRQSLKIQNTDQYAQWVNSTYSKDDYDDFTSNYNFQDLLSDRDKAEQISKKLDEARERIKKLPKNQIQPYFVTKFAVNAKEAAEFHTIRVQISIMELYREKLNVVQTGVNSVEFFIPVKVEGVGEAKVYSINFNHYEISRCIYALGVFFLLLVACLVYKWRKRRQHQKNERIKQDIEQMEEDIAWK